MDRVFTRKDLSVAGCLVSGVLCGIPLLGILFGFSCFSQKVSACSYYGGKYSIFLILVMLITIPVYTITGVMLCTHGMWFLAWPGMALVSFFALRVLAVYELKILDRLDAQAA
ncbi:hypothetical protein ACE3JM_23515 [Enterobacter hormaechei subsp. steigerwaltii]